MDYRNILRTKIRFIITNDLTIGRTDNDLIPFTSLEIYKFIEDNINNIEKVVDIMIEEYRDDDDLESLENPLLDLITEYLYDYVNTAQHLQPINEDDAYYAEFTKLMISKFSHLDLQQNL